jgi:hypothetical protein
VNEDVLATEELDHVRVVRLVEGDRDAGSAGDRTGAAGRL